MARASGAPTTRFRSNGARTRPAARDTSPPLMSLVALVRGHIRVDVAEGDPDREGLPEFLGVRPLLAFLLPLPDLASSPLAPGRQA